MHTFERPALDVLLRALKERQYTVIAPTVRDSAVVYDSINSIAELPIGRGDKQGPATYRLTQRSDPSVFGFVVGPHSWKKFLFPASLKLLEVRKKQKEFSFISDNGGAKQKFAFLGVRPCELHAIGIQDRIFHSGEYIDPTYQALRQRVFIVAVNCTEPGETCFCASMQAGPKAERGYDILLTEMLEEGRHYFLAHAGTNIGEEVLKEVTLAKSAQKEIDRAEEKLKAAAERMGRTIDMTNLKEILYHSTEHPRWDHAARRCLACGNCTQVCPTCFCSTVEDVTDLAGQSAERWRRWDSCFTVDFSYIHGGAIRSSLKSRYRQWMTHKLAAWQDQFGAFGCVGCGRCITWCPVGIDITEEAKAIREQ